MLLVPPSYGQVAGGIVSQRGINEAAAALEQARVVVVESAGKRRRGEPLIDFMRRVAAIQPGETAARNRARTKGYVAELEQAARQTAWARRLPVLSDESEENRQLWKRINQKLELFSQRSEKAAADWRAETAGPAPRERSPSAPMPTPSPGATALADDLAQAITPASEALDALRDARP